MECNKEEALRAVGIAEKKMMVKDYFGAQKMTLRAKQLFPDLENIHQMLTVCSVHCTAAIKIQGSEMDWYGILQVEPTADEATIKKQYRKLALLLHPDKNKFSGAEYAFKLIGEAMRILSDQAKRAAYDVKRPAMTRTESTFPQKRTPPDCSSSAWKHPGFAPDATNHTVLTAAQFAGLSCKQQQNHSTTTNLQQPLPQSTAATILWTMCPFCLMSYQCYNIVTNRTLKCQNCKNPYIAYYRSAPGTRPGTGVGVAQSLYPESKDSISQGNDSSAHKVPQPQDFGGACNSMGSQGDDACASIPTKHCDEVKGPENMTTFETENVNELSEKASMGKRPVNDNSKKRKRAVDSESCNIESADSDESLEIDTDEQLSPEQNAGARFRLLRRSSRHLSYNNDKNYEDDDDDFVSVPRSKKSNMCGTSGDDWMNEMDLTQHAQTADKKPEGNIPLHGESNKQKKGDSMQENKFKAEGLETNDADQDGIDSGESTQHERPDEGCEISVQPEFLELPDSEFHDFDTDKTGDLFLVGQVWSVYDNLHGLPRYYAVIRKVLSTDFKLRITWLEALPRCAEEDSWLDAELPVACGGYVLGQTEVTEDRLMFSHLMKCDKGRGKIKYTIYPRKGEIWALYKYWDIHWSSNPEDHVLFEYEMVEVLMDYSEDTGGDVVTLVKVKGFQSLFVRMIREGSEATFHVPGGQSYRFSHQVPAYRMKGSEREDVPRGSFELDIAAFPCNFNVSISSKTSNEGEVEEIGSWCGGANSSNPIHNSVKKESVSCFQKPEAPISQKVMKDELVEKNAKKDEDAKCNEWSWQDMKSVMDKKPERICTNKLCNGETTMMCKNCVFKNTDCSSGISVSDSASTSKHLLDSGVNVNDVSVWRQHNMISSTPRDQPRKIPHSEFHDFMNDKTINKFQASQIWAVFDNLDNMPRSYAWIKKIDSSAEKVHITWLEICQQDMMHEEVMWLARKLPVACGVFKAKDCDCINPELFSHLIRDEPSWMQGKYRIYPRQGEVWAIYNRWSSGWTKSDHKSHKCSIVEVVSTYSAEKGVRVRHLKRINTHQCVFTHSKKPERSIPRACLLQFSHQVPAFKLQEEGGGKLNGCWELDPASVPQDLFVQVPNAT